MTAQADSPVEVMAQLFAALNRRDWDAAAELIDEEDVAEWYRNCLDEQATAASPALDDVLRMLPSVRLADAHLDEIRRTRELYTGIGNDFAGVSTLAELAELTPRQALARYLQASDPAWRFDAYFRRLQERGLTQLSTCPEPPRRHRAVIGLLRVEDDHAYLAYRSYWSDGVLDEPAAELKVAELRRTSAGWRLRRRGEIFDRVGFTVIAERATEIGA